MRWPVCMLLCGLMACSDSRAEPDPVSPAAPEPVSSHPVPVETEVTFEDVLDQYLALNQRLDDLTYRIQTANAELCPVRDRSIGISIHTVSDYPDQLQPFARGLLGVGDYLSVRSVRAGSPAEQAGIEPGDRVLKLGGSWLPSGPTAKTLYEALSRRSLAADQVNLVLARGEQRLNLTLMPTDICGYPAHLLFSEQINARTNGRDVEVSSEMVRTLIDDGDLALVIAHEMAHAIAGHMSLSPTPKLELEADHMALIMLARAGFDIDRVVNNWAAAPRLPFDGRPGSTHPSQDERLAQFRATLADIENGRPLDFTR